MLVLADALWWCQARAQSQLLGQLLPMVAQLPSAQARCTALARIWAAAVASDLETRRAVRTRQKTLPGAELKQLLSDAFVKEVVSGSAEGVPVLVHLSLPGPPTSAPTMQPCALLQHIAWAICIRKVIGLGQACHIHAHWC